MYTTGPERSADRGVLGRILAAQNVLFVLPDTRRIAGFFAEALISIPGAVSCSVCLADASVHAGSVEPVCEGCGDWPGIPDIPFTIPFGSRCRLEGNPGMFVFSLETNERLFGFFAIRTDGDRAFEPYQPFLGNLANYVTFSLDNRLKGILLKEAHATLESKVIERTRELHEVNEMLTAEVAARRKAEEDLRQVNEGLERRIKDLEHQKKIFLGREMRIIELKERLKKLEGQRAAGGSAG